MSFLDFLAQALTGIHPDSAGSDTSNTQSAPAADGSNGIVVNADRIVPQMARNTNYPDAPTMTPQTNGPDAPDFGNRSWVEAARAAVINDRGKPKSRLHQTLDNIGDAFLMAGGLKPIHKDRQDAEDLSNALQGFTQHPDLAAERANTVDAKAGQDVWNSYQENQYKQGTLASLEASRQSQAENRISDNIIPARLQLQNIVRQGKTPDARQRLAMIYGPLLAKQVGGSTTMEDLGIIPGMSNEDLDAFANGNMSAIQQAHLPLDVQKANAATKNADAHMKNASRPPRPFAPHAITNVQSYIGQDGYKYTQRSDNTVVKSPVPVLQKKGATGRRAVAPPSRSGWGPVTRH